MSYLFCNIDKRALREAAANTKIAGDARMALNKIGDIKDCDMSWRKL